MVILLSRDAFIQLDPISAMHLGLTNDPLVEHRAELLSRYILKKVPNHLLDERERKERRVSQELLDEESLRKALVWNPRKFSRPKAKRLLNWKS
jgi:hypothetical protein